MPNAPLRPARHRSFTRRDALRSAAALAVAGMAPAMNALAIARAQSPGRAVTRGRLQQSVSRWCYQKMPLPDLCRAVAAMGVPAIDLLEPEDWPVARDHGLVCSMGYGGGGTIRDGLNNRANHDRIIENLIAAMPKAAAEQHRVTVCVELLNSKVDHADYQGDRTAFGVDVVAAVNSPRVKLLYDIYHMQIMEGDVIRTIRQHHMHIAHYHTGGVPGRHELDDTQELQWPAICRAIVETGFTGYLAHEFVPVRDPMTSLREAVVLCDV